MPRCPWPGWFKMSIVPIDQPSRCPINPQPMPEPVTPTPTPDHVIPRFLRLGGKGHKLLSDLARAEEQRDRHQGVRLARHALRISSAPEDHHREAGEDHEAEDGDAQPCADL